MEKTIKLVQPFETQEGKRLDAPFIYLFVYHAGAVE